MIEQIGSSADEAVEQLEGDVAKLRQQLHVAKMDSKQAHAAAKAAVGSLESASRERDSLRLQVSQKLLLGLYFTAISCTPVL